LFCNFEFSFIHGKKKIMLGVLNRKRKH